MSDRLYKNNSFSKGYGGNVNSHRNYNKLDRWIMKKYKLSGSVSDMKIKEYNKLVRDKIPEIIKKSGKQIVVTKASGDQLLSFLKQKLKEELEEYSQSGDIEELADLVEVIYAILEHKGISQEEFHKVRQEKNDRRGAFKEGLVLKRIIEE